MNADLILRQVRTFEFEAPVDVVLAAGCIAAISPRYNGAGEDFDGTGCTLIPGLIDHHLHILASAAARESLDLSGLTNGDAVVAAIRNFAANLPSGKPLRATGYDELAGGLVTRHDRRAMDVE
jgi:predicted amidohydrolase YtcJ